MMRLFRKAGGPATVESLLDEAATAEEVVDALTRSIRALTSADGACIIQRQNDECAYLTEDAIAPLWAGQRFPLAMCVTGMAMLERKTIVIPDIMKDRRIPLNAYIATFVRSMVAVPIGNDIPSFAMSVYWRAAQPVPAAAITRMTELAARAAIAFDRVGIPPLAAGTQVA